MVVLQGVDRGPDHGDALREKAAERALERRQRDFTSTFGDTVQLNESRLPSHEAVRSALELSQHRGNSLSAEQIGVDPNVQGHYWAKMLAEGSQSSVFNNSSWSHESQVMRNATLIRLVDAVTRTGVRPDAVLATVAAILERNRHLQDGSGYIESVRLEPRADDGSLDVDISYATFGNVAGPSQGAAYADVRHNSRYEESRPHREGLRIASRDVEARKFPALRPDGSVDASVARREILSGAYRARYDAKTDSVWVIGSELTFLPTVYAVIPSEQMFTQAETAMIQSGDREVMGKIMRAKEAGTEVVSYMQLEGQSKDVREGIENITGSADVLIDDAAATLGIDADRAKQRIAKDLRKYRDAQVKKMEDAWIDTLADKMLRQAQYNVEMSKGLMDVLRESRFLSRFLPKSKTPAVDWPSVKEDIARQLRETMGGSRVVMSADTLSVANNKPDADRPGTATFHGTFTITSVYDKAQWTTVHVDIPGQKKMALVDNGNNYEKKVVHGKASLE